MLKELFTNNLTRWDKLLFHRIFSWSDKKFLNRSLRLFSWSANGYLYPLIVLYIFLTGDADVSAAFLVSAAFAFSIDRCLYILLKQSMKRDRPFEGIVDVEFRVQPPDRFSFPSGHTASAFLMATLLVCTLSLNKAEQIPIFLWASTVGVARVYLGVHYPTDVLAGAILGITTAQLGMLAQAFFVS